MAANADTMLMMVAASILAPAVEPRQQSCITDGCVETQKGQQIDLGIEFRALWVAHIDGGQHEDARHGESCCQGKPSGEREIWDDWSALLSGTSTRACPALREKMGRETRTAIARKTINAMGSKSVRKKLLGGSSGIDQAGCVFSKRSPAISATQGPVWGFGLRDWPKRTQSA